MQLKKQFVILLSVFCVTGVVMLVLFYQRTVSQRDAALEVLRSELVGEIEAGLKWITVVEVQEIQRQLRGVTDRQQQIDRIWEMVANVWFFDDNSGYFFVYDREGVTIALPPSPNVHGVNRFDLKDSNGVYLIRDLLDAANRGGDSIIYHYPKPGETNAAPKLAYSMFIPGTDFFIGTGVYIDDVDEKVAATKKRLDRDTMRTLWTLLAGGSVLAVLVGVAIYITASMLKALANATRFMTDIAKGEGDLTVRMPVRKRDEIGQLGDGFNGFVEKIQRVVVQLKQQVNHVNRTSSGMEEVAGKLSVIASELGESVTQSSAASGSLARTIKQFSDTTEAVSGDVSGVASAVEELNVTIQEVARSCAQESQITGAASLKSKVMRDSVAELRAASDEIHQVIEIIGTIAKQTNLLALNATIEAASAGEAGKGFAVVANEVKELARQSADAAQRIARQIERMQSSSTKAIEGVEEMTGTIQEIDHIANTIASTVEEQSSATTEIAKLTQRVADSLQNLSRDIEGIAGSAGEVADSVEQAGQLAKQTASGAQHTQSNVHQLQEVAKELDAVTNQFII
jgi:methyl-accepting chemotaxis protein